MTVLNVFCTFTGPLMTILSSSNSELVYVCLCHIDVLLSKVPKLFEQEYRSFFSRYGGGSGNQRLGWVIYTVLNIVTSSKLCFTLYCVSLLFILCFFVLSFLGMLILSILKQKSLKSWQPLHQFLMLRKLLLSWGRYTNKYFINWVRMWGFLRGSYFCFQPTV